jgi:hypothetical protein
MKFWSWVPYCLCSEFSFLLWAWLKIVDGKLWLSLEYKSCSLFSINGCRMFIRYHRHCGMKVIMMLSSSIGAVLFCSVVCFYRSLGGSVGSLYLLIVSCVWLFWCWELLMVRWFSFGSCFNFVPWQLEKTSKYSAVVYTLSLVIWITST